MQMMMWTSLRLFLFKSFCQSLSKSNFYCPRFSEMPLLLKNRYISWVKLLMYSLLNSLLTIFTRISLLCMHDCSENVCMYVLQDVCIFSAMMTLLCLGNPVVDNLWPKSSWSVLRTLLVVLIIIFHGMLLKREQFFNIFNLNFDRFACVVSTSLWAWNYPLWSLTSSACCSVSDDQSKIFNLDSDDAVKLMALESQSWSLMIRMMRMLLFPCNYKWLLFSRSFFAQRWWSIRKEERIAKPSSNERVTTNSCKKEIRRSFKSHDHAVFISKNEMKRFRFSNAFLVQKLEYIQIQIFFDNVLHS